MVFDFDEQGNLSADKFEKFVEERDALVRIEKAEGGEFSEGLFLNFTGCARHAAERSVVKNGDLAVCGQVYVDFDGVALFGCARISRIGIFRDPQGGIVQSAMGDGGGQEKAVFLYAHDDLL